MKLYVLLILMPELTLAPPVGLATSHSTAGFQQTFILSSELSK